MVAASFAPARVMTLWGAIYVPLSGLWLAPALDAGLELVGGFVLLAVIGAVLYGATTVVVLTLWQNIRLRWSLRPLFVSGGRAVAMGLSVALAESMAAAAGFVLAPLGLLAVYGGYGWLVAGFGVFATSGILAGLAAGVVFSFPRRPAIAAGVSAVILTAVLLPAPPRPASAGITMAVVSHNPDPVDKWTPDGSQRIYDTLVAASAGLDDDLVIWPENAMTASFDLDLIAENPPLGDQAHLFGMTRFVAPNGPTLVNSAVLFEAGRMQASDKIHLAPVIERSMPLFAPTNLIPGTRRILTLANGTRILTLLCYEAAFPVPDVDLNGDPDIIIVLAAETGLWHRMTGAIAARHARARELETRIRVLRVSDRR
jgi:apolipoprotein N-acyltransferase